MGGKSNEEADEYEREALGDQRQEEAKQKAIADAEDRSVQRKGLQSMQRSVRSVATSTLPKKNKLGN